MIYAAKSHLLQMRGLKQSLGGLMGESASVASFTDAWIETHIFYRNNMSRVSHLLQMRGLKQRDSRAVEPK